MQCGQAAAPRHGGNGLLAQSMAVPNVGLHLGHFAPKQLAGKSNHAALAGFNGPVHERLCRRSPDSGG